MTPKKPSRWRAKAAEIRAKRKITISPPTVQSRHVNPSQEGARVYGNAQGERFLFLPSRARDGGRNFQIIRLSKPRTEESPVVEGRIELQNEEKRIWLSDVSKSFKLKRVTEDRTRVKMRGYQFFQAVLDYAIALARERGYRRIGLASGLSLLPYYKKWGFVEKYPIYEHENTGRIIGYEVEYTIH